MRFLWRRSVKPMHKASLAGTGRVFSFTLCQHYKSKATIITLAILLLFSLASVPLMSRFGGGSADPAVTESRSETVDVENASFLREVLIRNDTDLSISADAVIAAVPAFADAEFTETDTIADLSGSIGAAGVHITGTDGSYHVTVTAAPDTVLTDDILDALAGGFSSAVHAALLDASGITGEQLSAISAGWSVSTADAAELAEDENSYSFDILYGVNYVYSFAVMFLCIMSTSYILSAMVEEKSSKLVEVLLVSVQPLALIAGKILAVMTWMTIDVILLLCGFGISCLLAPQLPGGVSITALADSAGLGTLLNRLDWTILPVILFSLLLGYATFSLLGGFFGSGCSTTEDITGANLGVTMLVIAGYIAAIFQGVLESRTLSIVLSLLPFFSVFCAPANYLLDVIGPGVLVASWLIQLAVIAGLARLTAAVYRSLIFYNGSRIKMWKLLSVARQAKGGAAQ